MSSSGSLADRLAAHPELEHRVSALLDIVEAESGLLDRADDAEQAVIKHLRCMGNELLKKHLLVQHLRKNSRR